MTVDTANIRIRTLTFPSLTAALQEAELIAEAARSGRCTSTGNWSAGQTFSHLAWWIDAIDNGALPRPPWFLRLLGPLVKRKVLYGPVAQGFRLPGTRSGTYGDEPCDVETGIQRLRAAYARLLERPIPGSHPFFGRMNRDEWLLLHRRHAELHLGYLAVN